MASTTDEPEINPYELLNLSSDATDQDIKSAYRKQSLKVHPDRNPNNPDAARKFHELNQAYELLLDPLRRLALDAKLRATQARKERFKAYDAKRKNLVEELEERERAFKKARVQKQKEEMAAYTQTERIKEEGRKMREEREKALKDAEKAKEREEEERREKEEGLRERGVGSEAMMDVDEPPPLDQFDTTVRLKYSLKSKPDLTSKEAIGEYLAPFGLVDVDSIVFSLKAKKSKSKSKAKNGEEPTPTHATALVPFKNISDAYASVTASSTSSSSRVDMTGMEITWVNNKEPAILGWLKEMGKLPTPGASRPASAAPPNGGPSELSAGSTPAATPLGAPAGSTPFSSFPTAAPSTPSQPPSFSFPGGSGGAGGLDYESLTLLRLRQAERERLEREIREREAEDES